jgi:hypothetical protein
MQSQNVRRWRQQFPLFFQILRSLTLEEAQLLGQHMLARYALQDEEEQDWLNLLLAQINMFVPGALTPLLPTLVAKQHFYPGQLYLQADKEICQQLLSLTHAQSETNLNDLLQALAWIGNEEVQAQFHSWRFSPPNWRTELFVPPEAYSFEAGWELTEDGKRRDLYFSTCFELISTEQSDPFQITLEEKTAIQEQCAWCQRPLQMLLDLDLRDPRCKWISAEGERLCIAVCTWCSFYETTYLDITLTGEAHWSRANGDKPAWLAQIRDDGETAELPAKPLRPGMARRTPFEAVGRFCLEESGVSQLGGHPEWIQDAVYPQCPTCQQTMPCLGQVAGEDWYDIMEGSFYLFLCLPCRKAATLYQQT